MRALLVGNVGDGEPGLVGERFEYHGYQFERVDRDHPETWPTLDGAELVVLLGSEWSVYWPDIVDAVEAEAAAIRECVQRDIPIFGICFGSQMSAHALGGRVFKADHKEIGWYHVEPSNGTGGVASHGTGGEPSHGVVGEQSPGVVPAGPWMQWHSDVVELPPGAVQMAVSDVGPQAWRVGRTFCVQFHPEATGSIVERWVRGGGHAEASAIGRDPEQLIADSYVNSEAARPNTNALVDWFVAEVIGSPSVSSGRRES